MEDGHHHSTLEDLPTTQESLSLTQCTDLLIEKLDESGVVHLLRRFISNRLTRFGWHAALRHSVLEYVRNSGGPSSINVSHMWGELAGVGMATTPQQVREEVLHCLAEFGRGYIQVGDGVELEPEEYEPIPYEMLPRDTIPETPSGLYPPSSAESVDGAKYVKPVWLFVYDKPTPPTDPAAATPPPENGGESPDSSSSSGSSPPSTPPSNEPSFPEHGKGRGRRKPGEKKLGLSAPLRQLKLKAGEQGAVHHHKKGRELLEEEEEEELMDV